MNNVIHTFLIGITAICYTLLYSSCDAHDDHELPPDTSIHLCDVVCSDGSVVRFDEYKSRHKIPSAIVFHVNGSGTGQVKAYAVCLYDIESTAFSDSLGAKQNTSASITAHDGNTNTFTLLGNKNIHSPMADLAFQYMDYGQSAYIPSVAQMDLLYHAKPIINETIKKCGGVPLPESPESWYWTSTEVEGQEQMKAWLYSLVSGLRLETSKIQNHRVRPIITIY